MAIEEKESDRKQVYLYLEDVKKLLEDCQKRERERIVEMIEQFAEDFVLDVEVMVCDCGEPYKDSDLSLRVKELQDIIKKLKN